VERFLSLREGIRELLACRR
jgi:hypothetical protein